MEASVNQSDSSFDHEIEVSKNMVYALGVKLEQMVEQILSRRGFETSRRERLKGVTGAIHEIDIIAKRSGKVIAIECKNYGESRTVGIEDIRNFNAKIQDLQGINRAMFVTNVEFSKGVLEYASQNNIELWNGEKLQHDFYLLNLGRLDGKEEVLIGTSLPNIVEYEEATKLSLLNPEVLNVSKAVLNFKPYYMFSYELNMKKGFLGRQIIHEKGEIIVDGITKKIISQNDLNSIRRIPEIFLSKYEKQDDMNDFLNNIEYEFILQDLESIKPQDEYKILRTSEYAINKLDAKISINSAERIAKEHLMQENKAKYDEIKIKPLLLYIPKWLVTISSKESVYEREVLSCSGRTLIDQICLCPRDLSSKIRSQRKQTYAVCTICGKAFCKNHIYQNNEYFFCEKHNYRSSIQRISKEGPIKKDQIQTNTNLEESYENIQHNLENFIDKALQK
jgi:hypothetical protein